MGSGDNTIVLVNLTRPFRARILERHAPLACMYLSSSLKKIGFDVIVEDITRKEIDESLDRIKKTRPLFVGISVTFGTFSESFIEYSRKVKEIDKGIPVVWGGVHASAVPELCLKADSVDYVCLGEGEATIQELAIAIKAGKEPRDIEGVCYKKDGKVIVNPWRSLERDIDNFRIDWDCSNPYDYIELDKETGKRVFRSYRGSRGCPFACTFCYNASTNRRRFRPHSVNYVLRDMKMLREKYGVDVIQFTDDNFFANKRRAIELLRDLKKIGITATNLDIRATDVDEEIVKTLAECDCKSIYVGLESENETVLKFMKKKIRKEDFLKALNISRKWGITIATQMIIGIPTHTREEILGTIGYSIQLLREFPHCSLIIVPYLPLPGTVMFQKAIEDGYTPFSKIESFDGFGTPTGYLKGSSSDMSWLKWATKQDIKKLRAIAPMSTYALLARPSPKDSFLIRKMKSLFFEIACFRLTHLFFWFPLDYYLFNTLMKIWISRKRKHLG